jgi:hypothetical protein
LALALLRFGSEGGDATILVGKAPPAYAADVHVPAGGQVLGSLVSPSRATVIVTGKATREALRDDIERALASRGWARFQPPFAQRGGFVQESSERYAQFCKGTSSAVTVSSAALDVSTAQVRLDFGEGQGRCDPPPRDAMMESQRMQFPTLRSPATSGDAMRECVQSSMSGSRGMSSTATRVRTSMSPSELLAHYGAQLTAQGWQRTAERESATWTMRDSTGTLRTATVSAVRGERPNCYNVEMSVSAERE